MSYEKSRRNNSKTNLTSASFIIFPYLIILFIILITHLTYFVLYKQQDKHFLEKMKCFLEKMFFFKLSASLGKNETSQYPCIQIRFCQYLKLVQGHFLIFWKTWRSNFTVAVICTLLKFTFLPNIRKTGTTRWNKSYVIVTVKNSRYWLH